MDNLEDEDLLEELNIFLSKKNIFQNLNTFRNFVNKLFSMFKWFDHFFGSTILSYSFSFIKPDLIVSIFKVVLFLKLFCNIAALS